MATTSPATVSSRTDNTLRVGLLEPPVFHTIRHQLGDETITFYTDGVTEARRTGQAVMFGENRLLELIAGLPHDPREITDRITQSVLDFQDGLASDDIAIVTLAVDPIASSPANLL